jgi:hypothetical protein
VLVAGILSITIVAGILAGSYPAFVLSRFNPVKVLKGAAQPGLSGNALRKFLVVVQFTASIILVVGSIAVYKQISFISEKTWDLIKTTSLSSTRMKELSKTTRQ